MGPTVIWQMTQKCDLGCRSCILSAEGSRRAVDELSTFEAYKALDQIAAIHPSRFIMSGGDPLSRQDTFQLVEYACRRELDPELTIAPSRNMTRHNLEVLQGLGLRRVSFSVHGSTAARHDAVLETPGIFGPTTEAIEGARHFGMSVNVDTLITRRTMNDLGEIAQLLDRLGVVEWNLYFLVPVAGSNTPGIITAEEAEQVFAAMASIASSARVRIRTVEAPHYRRYLMQQQSSGGNLARWSDFSGYVEGDDPRDSAIDDIIFINSRGEVRPSEFLPLTAGNLRYHSLDAILRGSDLFARMHARNELKGKCGRCEFRDFCGGSRARAWAVTGDLFAPDPLCSYEPVEVSA